MSRSASAFDWHAHAVELAARPQRLVSRKPKYFDWSAHEKTLAKQDVAVLKATVPAQWARHIDLLGARVSGLANWEQPAAWRERIAAFRAAHGDALQLAMGDSEICTRAKAIAANVGDFLKPAPVDVGADDVRAMSAGLRVDVTYGALSEADQLDVVLMVCMALEVDPPKSLTGAGAVARALDHVWWRRVLRKKVARVVEHGAIKLGVVSKTEGGYASDDAVQRRGQQLERNRLMLEKTIVKNEAGQNFSLFELAKKSTANPAVRGGELMTRIRGCEEYAVEQGHFGLFFTQTTPSRFHAVTVGGRTAARAPRANPLYDGKSTPRDAQAWLCQKWARARSEMAREGIKVYGFRVAEPHHDGTPHWHSLLWFETDLQSKQAMLIIGKHWLSDGGGEPGAKDHRVNVKPMIQGGAAGYIAKYISKNIGQFDVGQYTDEADGQQLEIWAGEVKGWQRVDAWAATWGIRQFQAIGQPSVGVWRELRRVSEDQISEARTSGDKRDGIAQWLHGAVHKAAGSKADWGAYMRLMGGVCLRRLDWLVQPAKRINEVVNGYGEAVTQKIVVGVQLVSGRWLVSRRQAWARVAEPVPQSPDSRDALAAPWTRFTNCTARLTGRLRAALLGLDNKEFSVRYSLCPI